MYGPPEGRYPQPPRRSGGLRPALWMLAALVVVVACAVTIAVVLTGGKGSPQADSSTPPASGSPVRRSSADGSPIPTATITAPTTDALPSNAQSASCSSSVPPNLVAVEVVTVLGLVQNKTPDATTQSILSDCVSSAVRSRISRLYGVSYGVDYSADLTGGDNKGSTARYSVNVDRSSAKLTLTLTKQQDGHYEVTDFTYG